MFLIAVKTLRRDTLLLVSASLHSLCGLLLLSLLLHVNVREPGVLQGLSGADTQFGAELKHSLKQVNASVIDGVKNAPKILGGVHLEGGLVLRELRDARPSALSRGAHNAEDADDLVLVGRAWEEGAASVHLSHDATR